MPTSTLVATLAPHLQQPQRFLAERQWLFWRLIAYGLLNKPITATTVRITMAYHDDMYPPCKQALGMIKLHVMDWICDL